ncbi:multicystatin-like [Prunus persica]|uniref:multicystatin-like n=1 Tax=Prunus persica TaxID=3760 RepID=UPI0009AB6059|nr:multicystatin-like [Prunus persica]
MATAIRSAVGKLGSKYSSRCHSNGRIVANMVRVGDFQIRSAVVNNYNIDRDVLFSTSKPPSSYGYSSRHPFLFGNYHKKPPPVLHLQYDSDFEEPCGGFTPCPCFIDDPDTISPTRFAVKEYNKQKNAQLQFVRVLKAWHERRGPYMLYYLTLEAVDEGVVKVYQAFVDVFCYKTMKLKLFGKIIF